MSEAVMTVPAGISAQNRDWMRLKEAAASLRNLQAQDGAVSDLAAHGDASRHVHDLVHAVGALTPAFPHDAAYLDALCADFARWEASGFGIPDFLSSLLAFQPQEQRSNGLQHVVVFPMYTQNGSSSRLVEAVLIEVVWPDFISGLEAGSYSNNMFVPVRFLDFTAGYDTNSAVLFPETVSVSRTPAYTWGAIFADREAARFRRVLQAAAGTTGLELPEAALEMLADQDLAEATFVMWDLIHDRTHMRGDLPFDPFMIKQRMPYFLYALEELRCDLTAFRECVRIEHDDDADPEARRHAGLVQYAVIFDRIFRFAITGSRIRNYDGLGGQLLFAWLHQHHVLHWTDSQLTIDWNEVADAVIALGASIDELYWRSIDRPKTAHWLAAYELLSGTLTPHPASAWAHGPASLALSGPPRALTDQVLDDEFPLSMFYEALEKKMRTVIASTAGITGASAL